MKNSALKKPRHGCHVYRVIIIMVTIINHAYKICHQSRYQCPIKQAKALPSALRRFLSKAFRTGLKSLIKTLPIFLKIQTGQEILISFPMVTTSLHQIYVSQCQKIWTDQQAITAAKMKKIYSGNYMSSDKV